MNEILSRIVADFFDTAKAGEDLPARIKRLRDETRKVVENEETIFGKFRELVESFREIIPEEKQRYTAAVKALSTTLRLSRQEIITAIGSQINELKTLEKDLLPDLPAWRDDLKAMESRSQQLKAEIAKLREKLTQLESEEKGILKSQAARKKEMDLAEKAVRAVLAEIGEDITQVKTKVEEFTAEIAPSQPVPQEAVVKSVPPSVKKDGGRQKSESGGTSTSQYREWQKKCPMCGGRMNFHIREKMWQCYSCAYEESSLDKIPE